MFTPMRKNARPAVRGVLAATLAVTVPVAAAYADPNDEGGYAYPWHFGADAGREAMARAWLTKRPMATPTVTTTATPTATPTATATETVTATATPTRRRGRHWHVSDRGFIDHHDDGPGRNCRPRTFFRIHQMSPRNFYLPRTRYIDGPGGSMTVTVTREKEVTAFLETENEKQKDFSRTFDTFDMRTLVEHLRRLGLPHLEERHMVFSGHEYTKDITEGMYGNMWYRVFGYRIGWSAWSTLGTCEIRKVGSGLASVPSRVEGWHYWETKHPTFKRKKLSDK